MEVLDKLIIRIRKHPIRVTLLLLVFFLIPLLIIHLLYSYSIPFLESHWSAGDLLGYYASFVTTLGTIALSLVAVWLTYTIAKTENEREEKKRAADITAAKAELIIRELFYYSPLFGMVEGESYSDILLRIYNISINTATDVQIINPILLLKNESKPIILIVDEENKNYIDGKSDDVEFIIKYGKFTQSESKLTFTLHYKDCYLIHEIDYEAFYENDKFDIKKKHERIPELITINYSASTSN